MKSNTTNYKYFRCLCVLPGLSVALLSGCNTGGQPGDIGGTANSTTAYFKGVKTGISTAGVGMNIQWSMDGLPIDTGKNVNDMAWHLLTLTVEDMHTPLVTPIAVNGLNYAIYPLPKKNRGEKLEVEDINCKSAQFSKNGDTCSAYIRVTYDTATGLDNPPVTSVQVVTNAYPTVSAMASIYVRPLFHLAQSSYRAVLPIESKYYVGSAVTSNPKQYRILSMQNVSMPSLAITELTKTTNPAFTLMHRQSIESSDPYYGPYSECSLTANANLNQVNYLPGINSQCILVYQASMTSSQATQIESVKLVTNSDTTTVKTLKLIANYVTGTPIPDSLKNGADFTVISGSASASGSDKIMHTNGVLTSGTISPSYNPFNLVNVSYDFIASKISAAPGVPYYQNGSINIANDPSIIAGQQIVTDASSTNPVTIGAISQRVIPGSEAQNSIEVTACGGAYARASAYIVPTVDLTNKNQINLHVDSYSNGRCGGGDDGVFDAAIPLSGYNAQIYSKSDSGCGGNKWHHGGKVSVSGSGCSGDNCSYTIIVEAWHGGLDGQCHDNQSKSFQLNFKRPKIYMQLSQLSNFTLQANNPISVGRYKQSLNAMLGTHGGLVAQIVNCPIGSNTCTASGLYSNGLSTTSMLYDIGLSAGDILRRGKVDFTRSDGYDLADFIISH